MAAGQVQLWYRGEKERGKDRGGLGVMGALRVMGELGELRVMGELGALGGLGTLGTLGVMGS